MNASGDKCLLGNRCNGLIGGETNLDKVWVGSKGFVGNDIILEVLF